ncbi:MAG: hypothetical protein Q8O86_05680, partial [Dehalococcoidia bacterium]|nr:hypothetical protein [Dehalococcoidia bacterium]
ALSSPSLGAILSSNSRLVGSANEPKGEVPTCRCVEHFTGIERLPPLFAEMFHDPPCYVVAAHSQLINCGLKGRNKRLLRHGLLYPAARQDIR